VAADNGAQFSVVVTNAQGGDERGGTLTVTEAPAATAEHRFATGHP